MAKRRIPEGIRRAMAQRGTDDRCVAQCVAEIQEAQSEVYVLVLAAYFGSSEEVQKVIRDQMSVVKSSEGGEREMALATIGEALFPTEPIDL